MNNIQVSEKPGAALDRGDLNEVRTGKHRLVIRDDVYEDWEAKETGGRLHERYRKD